MSAARRGKKTRRVGDILAFEGPYPCPSGCGGNVYLLDGSLAHSLDNNDTACAWFLSPESTPESFAALAADHERKTLN